MKKIMVCYDFSKNSEKALDVAAIWAKKFNSLIDLVYVDDQLIHAGLYADTVLPSFEENAHKYRNELFNEKVSSLRDKYSEMGVDIKGHLLFGNPAKEVLEFSQKKAIDLIVLGSKGSNLFSKLSIGSFAWSLVTTTHLPLLCVKNDMVAQPTKVLYAAELSKDESKTLEVLKGIVDTFQPHLEVGHVIGPDTELASDHEVTADELYSRIERKIDLAHQRALFKINDLVAKWKLKDASTFVDNAVHKNVAKKLLEHVESRDIDLLVLGSHAKDFWTRMFAGSVSEYVLKRSSKSFLIVPNKEL